VATLLATTLYSWAASRWRRGVFIPLAYRCFELSLLALCVSLLQSDPAQRSVWLERTFYVWASVFPVFTVSVCWSLMADLFDSEQAKRLFGFIAVGGSLGALAGSRLTGLLAGHVEPAHVMLLAIALLELATQCARRLDRFQARPAAQQAGDGAQAPLGGAVFSGLAVLLRSRYLLGIALFLVLHSTVGTFLNLQQYKYLQEALPDRAERTALLASMDSWVVGIELVMQCTLFHRMVGRLGLISTLIVMPLASLAGFVALGAVPTLGMLVVIQVLRRAANFGLTKPAREALFTVVSREDKYKAKAFIDTVVYRGMDMGVSWALEGVVLGLATLALIGAPLAGAWTALAVWLGLRSERLARAPAAAPPAVPALQVDET
jgi:AAA family ATP:ADP antiporter